MDPTGTRSYTMSRRHADIWSHPGHYLVDPYTWPSVHFWLRYSKCHIQPWKFKVKVTAKVKPHGHIWGLEFIRYVCFSFFWRSDHFWLRYSKFHVWPWKFKVKVRAKVKPECHIWGPEFYRYVCFSFCGNRTIFGWDIANSIFDLENSRSRSWRKSTIESNWKKSKKLFKSYHVNKTLRPAYEPVQKLIEFFAHAMCKPIWSNNDTAQIKVHTIGSGDYTNLL